MLKIENIDFELPQIGKEPKIGYADEYIEKTMLSGKIRRIYKGKRFYATFSYAFLTEEQIANLNAILAAQRQNGYVAVQINSPYGDYNGAAILEVASDQTRFAIDKDTGACVWVNWSMSVKGVDYAS